jgi:hypothetical protein
MTALPCAPASSCPSARSAPRGRELFVLNSQLPLPLPPPPRQAVMPVSPLPCFRGTRRPSSYLADARNSGLETLKRGPHGDPAAAPMVFADRLHGNVCDYLERCVGGARQILLSAIDAMLSTPIAPVGDLDAYLRHLLESVYPQKYAYLAEDDLRDLIALCHGLSAHVAIMSPTGRTLVVLLAVCFGCGFIEDPLYPWISARLRGDGPEHRRIDKTLSVLRIYATTAAKNLRKAS